MKKIAMLLLITLFQTTTSFSQSILKITEGDTIVSITPSQLKETNLIFIEHKKLLQENLLLYEQLSNYQENVAILTQMDSIKSLQLENYKNLLKDTKEKNNKRLWGIGGISIGLILWLLLK